MEEVSHKDIYDRLVAVEHKVDTIDTNTREIIGAFKAVQGAFTVLGWIASASKPILWIGGLITVIGVWWASLRGKH